MIQQVRLKEIVGRTLTAQHMGESMIVLVAHERFACAKAITVDDAVEFAEGPWTLEYACRTTT